jgi:hypothetical protein
MYRRPVLEKDVDLTARVNRRSVATIGLAIWYNAPPADA